MFQHSGFYCMLQLLVDAEGSELLHRNLLAGYENPDPREDLESRSPNLGPYTTKGTLWEPPLRDLLFGSSRGLLA